jgi:hypothetical protein
LYVPFPLTATGVDVYARVVQLPGPYSLKVIVPPAAAPAAPVRLITGFAGWVAAPLNAAESVTALPSDTPGPAVVANVGVTGVTVKHSVAEESAEVGIPLAASPLNVARQQYRPAEVT